MAYGDYGGCWANGIWYPYQYPTVYPTTVYTWPVSTPGAWQCPGCKTYYSPTITCCTCAKDAEESSE